MAGIAAEQLMCDGETEGGIDDRQRLRQVIGKLPNPMTQERWALLNAKNLLSDRGSALTVLASKMLTGATVEDCCQAIDEALEQNLLNQEGGNSTTLTGINIQ